jgi:glycerol uptake facilitator-like aquaporin
MNSRDSRHAKCLLAEGIGTALLLAVVVGSGIMGERLALGNAAVALLANAAATGTGLYVLIAVLGPISGAHFNPLVTAMASLRGDMIVAEALGYVAVQVIGALVGVLLAHAMFDLPLLQLSSHARTGAGEWLSEIIAAAGLLATILLGSRARPQSLPALIGAYIFTAYWFTASTSFANPAVAIARAFTDTFSGIRPIDVPAFMLAQCAGLILVVVAARALCPAAIGVAVAQTVVEK